MKGQSVTLKKKKKKHPFYKIKNLPLCFRKKSMLFCKTVDLSIFLALPGSMDPNSLMRTLN
jgi:hypothetical protein